METSIWPGAETWVNLLAWTGALAAELLLWRHSARQGRPYAARSELSRLRRRYSRRFVSARGRNRTCDTRLRRALLYPLSYSGSGLAQG
jgi:hypothetical protein